LGVSIINYYDENGVILQSPLAYSGVCRIKIIWKDCARPPWKNVD